MREEDWWARLKVRRLEKETKGKQLRTCLMAHYDVAKRTTLLQYST